MNVFSANCNNCGANIEFNEGASRASCAFCGTTKIIESSTGAPETNAEYERLLNLAEHMEKRYLMGAAVAHGPTGTNGYDAVFKYYTDAELAGGGVCPRFNLALARAYAKIVIHAVKSGEVVLLSTRMVLNTYLLFMDDGIKFHQGDRAALEAEKTNTIASLQEDLRPFPEKDPNGQDALGEKESCYIATNAVGEKKGGCYIATAIYGSYDCPPVMALRRFRDERLAASVMGRGFIRVYYRISPGLVRVFGQSQWFKQICRRLLDKLVSWCEAN